MYKPNPNCYGDMFAVPADILNIAIEEVSKESLLAILWIFKHPSEMISLDALTKALSLSADAALAALDFWVAKGVLLFTDDSGNVKFVPKAQRKAEPTYSFKETPAQSKPTHRAEALPTITFAKPTMEQIAARMREDNEVSALFTEAQCILGRTFGLDMQGTLLTFLDTYGLPKEVILTLLQHLVETGKSSNANIARVGKIWAEKEINTITEANEYIQKDSEVDALFSKLRMATGITAPKPTTKQAEYLSAWISLGFSFEMILDAYEEAAERTGKISFNYANKVLMNWKDNGFTSKADALKAKKQASLPTSTATHKKQTSFDLDEAVRKATFSSKKQS